MKGDGAYVKERTRLNRSELKILNELFKNPSQPTLGKDLELQFGWGERKVSGALSVLHGMDLIKSSSYDLTKTETEQGTKWTGKAPHYWIGQNKGEMIWQRAEYVLRNYGLLGKILLGEFDGGMFLFPLRKARKVTVLSRLQLISSELAQINIGAMESSEYQDLVQLSQSQKIKVTLESI